MFLFINLVQKDISDLQNESFDTIELGSLGSNSSRRFDGKGRNIFGKRNKKILNFLNKILPKRLKSASNHSIQSHSDIEASSTVELDRLWEDSLHVIYKHNFIYSFFLVRHHIATSN